MFETLSRLSVSSGMVSPCPIQPGDGAHTAFVDVLKNEVTPSPILPIAPIAPIDTVPAARSMDVQSPDFVAQRIALPDSHFATNDPNVPPARALKGAGAGGAQTTAEVDENQSAEAPPTTLTDIGISPFAIAPPTAPPSNPVGTKKNTDGHRDHHPSNGETAGVQTPRAGECKNREFAQTSARPLSDRPLPVALSAAVPPSINAVTVCEMPNRPVDPPVESAKSAARQLDFTQAETWQTDFIRDVSEVQAARGALHFRLTPATLGALDVTIHRSDAVLNVGIWTETDQAHSLISAALPKLEQELRTKGPASVTAQAWTADPQTQNSHDRSGTPRPRPARHDAPFTDHVADPQRQTTEPTGRFA
jgi:hypothetical protein